MTDWKAGRTRNKKDAGELGAFVGRIKRMYCSQLKILIRFGDSEVPGLVVEN